MDFYGFEILEIIFTGRSGKMKERETHLLFLNLTESAAVCD